MGSIQEAPLNIERELTAAHTNNADDAINLASQNHHVFDVEETIPSGGRSKTQTTIIMLALCSSLFLAALDAAITTTALPTITEQLHSSSGYTWVGSAYLLAHAACCPIWGKFSDIWGRKPILLGAVAVFFVGSLLCGASTSMMMLLVGRVVQGSAGGGINILTNICISDLFSMRNRGSFLGLLGLVHASAGALGPVLGGFFTELASWRWCFYINLPISAIAFTILFFYLSLKTPKTPLMAGLKAVDWLGSIAILGVTLMTLLGLNFGGVTFPWDSPKVICLIVFGLVMMVIFFFTEAKVAKYPLMPLKLFQHRSNIATLLVTFCHGFTYIAGSYYLPLFFQAVRGCSPLMSGVFLIPFAVTMSLGNVITGIYTRKTGKYLEPLWAGLTIMTLGLGLLTTLKPTTPLPQTLIYTIIAALGIGPGFQSPLIALQTLVQPTDIATATATLGFLRNISSSMSVVVGGVIFNYVMQTHASTLTAALGAATAAKLSGGSAEANVGVVKALSTVEERHVAREAYADSLGWMWVLYVCVSGAGLVASAFVGRQVLSVLYVETKTGLDVDSGVVGGVRDGDDVERGS
ncbi:MAG: hypothetical protein M1834_004634 [Cirrosporium novae-zelandiae]|nr:MAG: hypothetical protein M1834_004634 [Cirrosporium novae-zelandiae]